jgi:uncharacterized protein (TIGR03437 family)
MTHHRPLILVACASAAFAQAADSLVLLTQLPVIQIAADPQGNLLAVRRIAPSTSSPGGVFRYATDGTLLRSYTAPGQVLPNQALSGHVVLAVDPQGAIYLAGGNNIVRPTDSPQNLWTPQLPAIPLQIGAISFDPQNNPILAITDNSVAAQPAVRTIKLDRVTGQLMANVRVINGYGANGIAVDAAGLVYLTGMSLELKGYAAKVDLNQQQMGYTAFLDGAMPNAIAVDSNGSAYIAETPLAVPNVFGPGGGGIIHFGANKMYKLTSKGLIETTNAGGGLALAFDSAGNLVVIGGGYPPTGVFQSGCGPRFDLGGLSITQLDPVTLHPRNSAFLAQQVFLNASAPLPDGSFFVATQAGRILRVTPGNASSPIACIANGASFLIENSVVPGQLLTIFGAGLGADPISVFDDSTQLPFTANGTVVRIGGFPAPLLAVSSTQINAIVPFELTSIDQSQPVSVEISLNGTVIYTWQMALAAQNPTPLLHFDPVGALDFAQVPRYQDVLSTYAVPLADVLNQDGTHNSAANPAAPGSTVTIFATGYDQSGTGLQDGQPGDGQLLPGMASIPVMTPDGPLVVSSTTTIAGRTNAVLQIQATIPAQFAGRALPFVIQATQGQTPPGSLVWTNFLYVSR